MVTLFMGQPYTRNMLQLPNVQVITDCLRVGNSTSFRYSYAYEFEREDTNNV